MTTRLHSCFNSIDRSKRAEHGKVRRTVVSLFVRRFRPRSLCLNTTLCIGKVRRVRGGDRVVFRRYTVADNERWRRERMAGAEGDWNEIDESVQYELHLYAGESGPRSTNNCTHLFILIIDD